MPSPSDSPSFCSYAPLLVAVFVVATAAIAQASDVSIRAQTQQELRAKQGPVRILVPVELSKGTPIAQ